MKVFSQKYCPKCDELKNLLRDNNICFEEKDITEDNTAYANLLFNDIYETPVVEIDNKFLTGDIIEIYSKIKGKING